MSGRHHSTNVASALFALWWTVTMGWCLLAFADLAEAPEWLARTQAICFGSSMDGLPEPFGWVALVVGPVSMLLAFFAIFRADMSAALVALRGNVLGTAVIIIVLAATVGETAFIAQRIRDALVWDMDGVDACHVLEQLGGEMRRATDASR